MLIMLQFHDQGVVFFHYLLLYRLEDYLLLILIPHKKLPIIICKNFRLIFFMFEKKWDMVTETDDGNGALLC